MLVTRRDDRSASGWKLPLSFPSPSPPPCFPLSPTVPLYCCSLQSVSLALAKSSRCSSEQHYAELSSRVISDANTCPPGECELSCWWSQLNRGSCISIQVSSSRGNARGVGDTLGSSLGGPGPQDRVPGVEGAMSSHLVRPHVSSEHPRKPRVASPAPPSPL